MTIQDAMERYADDRIKEIKEELANQEANKSRARQPAFTPVFDDRGILVTAAQLSTNIAVRYRALQEEIQWMQQKLNNLREAMDMLTLGTTPRELPKSKLRLWESLAEEHGTLLSNIGTAKRLMLSWVNRGK